MLKKNTCLMTAFNEYIIQDQIGQGGNGTVFKAIDSSENTVAIKAINRDDTTRDKLKRFKNEIFFCQSNTHPNIIKVLDYGTYVTDDKSIIFYVMPLFDNTLKTKIEAGIPKNDILPIFIKVLDGIKFAHSKGVWHRDIKPENILIDKSTSQVVIADFGIAHFSEDNMVTSIETKATERLANFVYAAPEQRERNGEVDGHCDIFSLGLILNEMFTGKVISGTNYKTISDVDKNYAFVDTIVETMTAQSQQDRLYPAQEVLFQLKALIRENQIDTEIGQLVNSKLEKEEDFDYPCPKVIDAKYENSILSLYLNKVTPQRWNSMLRSGQYSYLSAFGFEPNKFNYDRKGENSIFFIEVSAYNVNMIEDIIKHFKEWIISTTSMYVTDKRENIRQERIQKEKKMNQLIEQKKVEKEVAKNLKNIL